MELAKNFQYMCRVCAFNVNKRRSSLALVPIFSTPQLVDNLRKHLNIDISVGDGLPEKVCANCFKKLESLHNFASLAKKTENFLKGIARMIKASNTKPFGRHENMRKEMPPLKYRNSDEILRTKMPISRKEPEQVVLNFSLNDPLTRDIESKILEAREAVNRGKRSFDSITMLSKSLSVDSRVTSESESRHEMSDSRINLEQKRKHLKMVLNNKGPQQPVPFMTEIPANVSQLFQNQPSPPPIPSTTNQPPPPKLISLQTRQMAQNLQNESVIYDCLNLGSVIKDIDLLKLILKALKWPYTNTTLPDTLQRLKNTRFRDVILDKNLLQDTDMMQILNTYLSPILLKAQNTPAVLPTVVSYKIPADTSVHLVNVGSEENSEQSNQRRYDDTIARIERAQMQRLQHQQAYPSYRDRKFMRYSHPPGLLRRRRRMKPKPPVRVVNSDAPIVVSDDDSTSNAEMFEVSIDPSLYFPQDGDAQENGVGRPRGNSKLTRSKSVESAIKVRKRAKRSGTSSDVVKKAKDKCATVKEPKVATENQNVMEVVVIAEDSPTNGEKQMPSTETPVKIVPEDVTPVREKQVETPTSSRPSKILKTYGRAPGLVNRPTVKKVATPQPLVNGVPTHNEAIDDPLGNHKTTPVSHRISTLRRSSIRLSSPTNKKTDKADGETSEATDPNCQTITIEDEDDDAVWADFKVVDSPEYTGTEEQVSKVKPIVVKTESKNDTEEATSSNTSIVKIEANEIKTEQVQETEQTEDVDEKKEETDVKVAVNVKQEVSPGGKMTRQLRAKSKRIDPSAKVKTEISPSSLLQKRQVTLRQSRRRTTIINHSPVKATATVKREAIKPKLTKKGAPERKSKTNSKYYVTPEQKVERDVKQRKRICKQCGFTFDNLMKFVEHRKKYHI